MKKVSVFLLFLSVLILNFPNVFCATSATAAMPATGCQLSIDVENWPILAVHQINGFRQKNIDLKTNAIAVDINDVIDHFGVYAQEVITKKNDSLERLHHVYVQFHEFFYGPQKSEKEMYDGIAILRTWFPIKIRSLDRTGKAIEPSYFVDHDDIVCESGFNRVFAMCKMNTIGISVGIINLLKSMNDPDMSELEPFDIESRIKVVRNLCKMSLPQIINRDSRNLEILKNIEIMLEPRNVVAISVLPDREDDGCFQCDDENK